MRKSEKMKNIQKLPSCARYSLPVHDQLLQKELRRIERSTREEARAAQHTILLKLATLSHARHIRDRKVDTLTRLMAPESTKLKLQALHSQRKTSAPRTYAKRNASENKPKMSREANTEHGKDVPVQKSTSSGSSGHSGISQVTRFVEEPEIYPQIPSKRKPIRNRAYSVDLFANPTISVKRRQSAPEVVVTPAATEMSEVLSESLDQKLQEDHLSPAYSAVTEFFSPDRPLTQQDITETEEEQTVTKGTKSHPEDTSDASVKSDNKSPSKNHSSLTTNEVTSERRGGIGSAATSLSSALYLKKGSSRKVSRSTNSSRRRSSHLSPKGHVKLQNEEFNPEKDPRFTDLLTVLKSTPVADMTAGVQAIQVSHDHTSSDTSTTNRQSGSESRSLISRSPSSSKSTAATSSVT